MKKSVLIAIAAVLVAGCGPSHHVAEDNPDVNIGYGTVKKDALTTSVSSVKVNDNEIRGYSDIYEYLQGRVAGVMVTPDHRILIRGINSINSSTDPLILVDGAEMSDLSGLNPHDVQSVDIIKDGSSSIYGVRGANGVILITTRR